MSDEQYSSDELPADWPEGIVAAKQQGVRVVWVAAATMPALVERLALVLGERMADDDELHVTYNAMQSGFRHLPPARDGNQWTELHFEYSAFVVLRPRDQGLPPLQ